MSPSRIEAKGSVVCHSGCCGRQRLDPVDARTAAGRTSAARPRACRRCRRPRCARPPARSSVRSSSVTARTKSTMACLVAPSFHDGSGSAGPSAPGRKRGLSAGSRKANRAFVGRGFIFLFLGRGASGRPKDGRLRTALRADLRAAGPAKGPAIWSLSSVAARQSDAEAFLRERVPNVLEPLVSGQRDRPGVDLALQLARRILARRSSSVPRSPC